jgi:hypothetical protein
MIPLIEKIETNSPSGSRVEVVVVGSKDVPSNKLSSSESRGKLQIRAINEPMVGEALQTATCVGMFHASSDAILCAGKLEDIDVQRAEYAARRFSGGSASNILYLPSGNNLHLDAWSRLGQSAIHARALDSIRGHRDDSAILSFSANLLHELGRA